MRPALGMLACVLCWSFGQPPCAGAVVAADTVFVGDWPPSGVWLTPTFKDITDCEAVPDGAGGILVAWKEGRNTAGRILVTRIAPDGLAMPGWSPNGNLLESAPGTLSGPTLAADGSGGAYLMWDRWVYPDVNEKRMQHIGPDGARHADWPREGKVVFANNTSSYPASIATDSTGACYLLWSGVIPPGRSQLRLQRFLASGEVSPGWPLEGVQLTQHTPDGPNSSVGTSPVGIHRGAGAEGMFTEQLYYSCCTGHGCSCYRNDYATHGNASPEGWALAQQSCTQGRISTPSQADDGGILFRLVETSDNTKAIERFTSLGACWSSPAPTRAERLVLDGLGGAFTIGAGLDIVGSHYSSVGTPSSDWGGASGNVLVTPSARAYWLLGAPAGNGGALLTWAQDGIPLGSPVLFATSLQLDGTISPGWAPEGNPILIGEPGSLPFVVRMLPSLSGKVLLVIQDQDSGSYDSRLRIQRLSVDQPVPTQVSLVSAVARHDHIALEWFAADDEGAALTVERTDNGGEWRAIASVYADGAGHIAYEDREVRSGIQYGYRLRDSQRAFAEAWVTMPLAAQFGIRSAVASGPSRVRVEFGAEAGADVDVSLFDLVGRRITRSRVVASGDASQSVELDTPNALAPGLYLVRVAAGEQSAQRRVMITR